MPDPDFLKELTEDLWGVARALVAAAAGKDPSAHGAAFLTFREAAFRDSATVAPSARFLTSLYDGDEALLAGWVQPAELVQELSAGQADLSLAVAGHWAVTKDWPRVIQITDALLTARMHLRSDNALSIMCALCTTLAFRRPHRANDLLAHVEECVKSRG